MMTQGEFFEQLLYGTSGRLELRQMRWNPCKSAKGAYDMLDRLFSRDLSEIEDFACRTDGDIFHSVNLRDDSGAGRKENISEIVGAAADIDFKTTPQDQADEFLAVSFFEPTILISSGNGYHPYWLLDVALTGTEENISLIESINRGLAQQFGGDYTHDVTRVLRTPGRKNSKYSDNRMCEIVRAVGPRYHIDALKCFAVPGNANHGNHNESFHVDIGAGGELPKRFQTLLAKHGFIQNTWNGKRPDIKDQSRSGYDMAMADLLVAHSFTPAEVATILRQMPSGKGADATPAYLQLTVSKALATKADDSEDHAPVIEIQNLTDLGNAKRFQTIHRGNVLYSAERNKWIIWNGRFWEWDLTGAILDFAEEVILGIDIEASQTNDKNTRIMLRQHATRTESRARVEAMLALAQKLPGIRTRLDRFDQHQFLLNCANGTLDLTTGKLREFSRDDYLTRCSPTRFDVEARCPRFMQFLNEITVNRSDLAKYLQQAAGYSLTGSIKEQCFFLLLGVGGNGKTTLVNTLVKVLGPDYAKQIRAEIFFESKDDSSKQYYLAELAGIRLAAACESDKRRSLAAALAKQATGGEQIPARRPYEMPFSYWPEFKLWFGTNHQPRIDDTTEGMWRRLKPIPFDAKFVEPIQGYEDVLIQEASGILNWGVRGCIEWHKAGLHPPECVVILNQEYREQEDVIGKFITDKCNIGRDLWEATGVLYSAYTDWCEREGEKPETKTMFGKALNENGFRGDMNSSKTLRIRRGLSLKSKSEGNDE